MAVIAFDTDETIYKQWDRGDGQMGMMLRWDVVNFAILFKEHHNRIVFWSGGGAEHSRRIAERLGISFLVDEFSMKSQADANRLGVDICFDDQFVAFKGVANIKV